MILDCFPGCTPPRFYGLSFSPDRITSVFDIGGMSSLSSTLIPPQSNDDAKAQWCNGQSPCRLCAFETERGPRMTAYFRRQLADYVEYHRDPLNCAAHVFGIIVLFLGAVLPLTLLPISGFGGHVTLATLLALPVLIYWLALDAGLGLAILAAAVVLLSTAVAIVANLSVPGVWIMAAVLIVVGVASQIVGHKVFEQRKPSMADHPAHFLLGPMFVMAKLFIALGFRDDLASIIGPVAQPAPASNPGNR
jgi:uncharacterized membrane protein YGL010W